MYDKNWKIAKLLIIVIEKSFLTMTKIINFPLIYEEELCHLIKFARLIKIFIPTFCF